VIAVPFVASIPLRGRVTRYLRLSSSGREAVALMPTRSEAQGRAALVGNTYGAAKDVGV
jgi:hypothetical protein